MAQVVGTRAADADRFGRRVEAAASPVLPVVERHPCAVTPAEQRRAGSRDVLHVTPGQDVLAQLRQEVDGAVHPAGLLQLQLAVGDRLLDQDGVLADVAAFEPDGFAGTDAGVGEHTHQRGREVVAGGEERTADGLNGRRVQHLDRAEPPLARLADDGDGVALGLAPLDAEREHRLQQHHRSTYGLAADALGQHVGTPLSDRAWRDLVERRVTEAQRQVPGPAPVVADDRRLGQTGDGVGAVDRPQRGQGVVLGSADGAGLRQFQRETCAFEVGLLEGLEAAAAARAVLVGPADGGLHRHGAVSATAAT